MACMMHRWGKDNKCVSCGRWKPGFAPKKGFSKDRAECQVCEALWALTQGKLGHHGYQRPGEGYIVGDCAGQGHLPFPETNALESWLRVIQANVAGVTKRLAELPAQEILTSQSEKKRKYGFERGAYEFITNIYEVRKSDGFYRYETQTRRGGRLYEDPREPAYLAVQRTKAAEWTKPSPTYGQEEGKYARELKIQTLRLEQELRFWNGENTRVTARIAKGVEMRAAGQTTLVVMKPAEAPSAKSL